MMKKLTLLLCLVGAERAFAQCGSAGTPVRINGITVCAPRMSPTFSGNVTIGGTVLGGATAGIQVTEPTKSYSFRAVGSLRDATYRYLTHMYGDNPGLATNGPITINGDVGDPVPEVTWPCLGVNCTGSMMVRPDVYGPSYLSRTEGGWHFQGYTSYNDAAVFINQTKAFEVSRTGHIWGKSLTATDAVVSGNDPASTTRSIWQLYPGSSKPLQATRNDLSISLGMQFTPAVAITVSELGRLYLSGNVQNHRARLWDSTNNVAPVATCIVTAASTSDINSFKWCSVTPVALVAGRAYYLVTEENSGGDTFFDFWTDAVTGGYFRSVFGTIGRADCSTGHACFPNEVTAGVNILGQPALKYTTAVPDAPLQAGGLGATSATWAFTAANSNGTFLGGVRNDGLTASLGGYQDMSTAAKPTCNSALRGTIYAEKGGAGVADQPYLCAKKSDDAYAWIQLVVVP